MSLMYKSLKGKEHKGRASKIEIQNMKGETNRGFNGIQTFIASSELDSFPLYIFASHL